MANVLALHAVCRSVATFLQNTYPEQVAGVTMPECRFDVVSAAQLAQPPDEATRITLFLYRVTVNEHSRQPRPDPRRPGALPPLSVDLHLLLSAWGATAADEQQTLGWTLRQLHSHPILDASSLTPEAGWSADEVIQLVPAELSTEDLMRIWDALEPGYRLSVSYIARTVRLDEPVSPDARPVVATRFDWARAVDGVSS